MTVHDLQPLDLQQAQHVLVTLLQPCVLCPRGANCVDTLPDWCAPTPHGALRPVSSGVGVLL